MRARVSFSVREEILESRYLYVSTTYKSNSLFTLSNAHGKQAEDMFHHVSHVVKVVGI
jgi:hypothetical protein